MENRNPEPLETARGWHHTLTAEAVRARLVAALSVRPSAPERKAAMNVLRPEKKLAVISALVEGVSIRSIERMTGVHRDTIMRLTVRVGERCAEILDETMRNLRCQHVQVDEIWTYVRKKQARVTFTERHEHSIGDQYVFVALDGDTKLVPHFEVGKRNMLTAMRMMDTLKARLAARFQLTTDGFVPYIGAVEHAWGADAPDFAQLVKVYNSAQLPGAARYSPPMLAEAIPSVVWGHPDPAHISTSYVERQNLTIRMACRRFTRLTNAFSKKLENLKAALALHFAHYNLVRIHSSLKVTPAMEAGVTNRVWDLRELLA
jgi:IS1 family transposase